MSQPRGRCFALPPLLSAPHSFLSCPPPPGPPVPPPTPLLQRFLPSPESLSPLTTATPAWHRPGGGSNSRGKPPSRRPVAASPHPTLAQARVAATFPTTTTTAVPRVGRHSTPHPTPAPKNSSPGSLEGRSSRLMLSGESRLGARVGGLVCVPV